MTSSEAIERLGVLLEPMAKIADGVAALVEEIKNLPEHQPSPEPAPEPEEPPDETPPEPEPEPEMPGRPDFEKLPLVAFTEPPLLLNHGSWDKRDQRASHKITADGRLVISLAQDEQPKERVIRRDFGLQVPGRVGGGFLREPAGRRRGYSLEVYVPENYDSSAEMVNVFQWHTHSAKAPPYLSFFLWTKDAYWRHNLPDGSRQNYNRGPIKRGHLYRLQVEALWSQGKDGMLQAWEDGQSIFRHEGPNYRASEKDAPYVVFGQYAPSAGKRFSNWMEFGELRIGDL